MKRSEELIRDGFGTIVTFLVLALLLFHSPYSKAQTRKDNIAAISKVIYQRQFNESNVQSHIDNLFVQTFGDYLNTNRVMVEPSGMSVINHLLEMKDPKISFYVLELMHEVTHAGAKFGDATVLILLAALQRSMDPLFISSAVKFLKRYENKAPGVTTALMAYERQGNTWVRKYSCVSAVGGASKGVSSGVSIGVPANL